MRRLLIFLSVLPVTPVLPLLGQTDPRLVEVIRDAQEGDSDSARMKVQQLLTATAPTDTDSAGSSVSIPTWTRNGGAWRRT